MAVLFSNILCFVQFSPHLGLEKQGFMQTFLTSGFRKTDELV